MKIISGISVLLMVLAYQLWPYMSFHYGWLHFSWHSFFYQLIAVGVSLLFFAFWRTTKWIIVEIGFWLSINNSADELFFEPTKAGYNELFFALIITFLILRKCHQIMKKQVLSPS